MGEHSKPSRSRTLIEWVAGHKRTILGFIGGVVAAITAVRPDFPGRIVMDVANALLG